MPFTHNPVVACRCAGGNPADSQPSEFMALETPLHVAAVGWQAFEPRLLRRRPPLEKVMEDRAARERLLNVHYEEERTPSPNVEAI